MIGVITGGTALFGKISDCILKHCTIFEKSKEFQCFWLISESLKVETVRIKEAGCRRVHSFIWKCISQNLIGVVQDSTGKHKSAFCNSFKNKKMLFVANLYSYFYYLEVEG
jgi:hypothetical protein